VHFENEINFAFESKLQIGPMLEYYLRALGFLPWWLWLAWAELDACHWSGVRLRVREWLVETSIEMFDVRVTAHAIRLIQSILLMIRTP
jgi:hypothetical protein